ncbi:MAG: DUF1697 domain-containing protein [Acidimicrobiales bacterium]
MIYIALLRGINVGGKSPVSMAKLKETFEQLGFAGVRTYINSGNVVFTAGAGSHAQLAGRVEAAIADDFGLQIPVLVRTADELSTFADSIPTTWVNDATMKCDVFFLWPDVDRPDILDEVPQNAAIEDLRYVPGALVRRIDRKHATRSPIHRIVGSALYGQMTVRNINTVRKLRDLAGPTGDVVRRGRSDRGS